MDAKKILYNFVYVVVMNRWGSEEGHHYTVGVFDNLDKAKKSAEEEHENRGGKYEWIIEAWSLNKDRSNHPMAKKYFRVAKSKEMGCTTDEEIDRYLKSQEPPLEWFEYCAKLDINRLREELTQERQSTLKWMGIAKKLQEEINGRKDI